MERDQADKIERDIKDAFDAVYAKFDSPKNRAKPYWDKVNERTAYYMHKIEQYELDAEVARGQTDARSDEAILNELTDVICSAIIYRAVIKRHTTA